MAGESATECDDGDVASASAAESSELVTRVIVHELRNALAVAAGNADLLADAEGGTSAARDADGRALDRLENALDRMGRTLADAERIVAARPVASPECVDLGAAATAAFERVRAEVAPADTEGDAPTLTVECGTVAADPSLLAAALENLVRNALEHGADAVVVRELADGEGFLVADSGPGVPEAIRDRAFEPGVSTRTGGGASGLGLHIVERVATAHGWTVELREGPPDYPGACFAFRTGDGVAER